MVKKKRHHYIPRFYLKRFSIDNEGTLLCLYNLKNRKYIQGAPLKSQAYENFLYGEDDEIENILAEMEGAVAYMFHNWIEEKLLHPPEENSDALKLLKRFILYQLFRTPKSGNELMQVMNKGFKVLANEMGILSKLKGGTLIHKNPVLLRLLSSVGQEQALDFLHCRFLVNLSLLPFVTSDAPVILYNQLMEKANNYVGATGLATKGLQIFYPIHPRLMICFYDPLTYNFGDDCKNCCSTESIEDVHQLNGLQLANCNSQLFFDESVSEDYIKQLWQDYHLFRDLPKSINKIVKKGNKQLLFTSFEGFKIDLELAFYKLKVDAKNYSNIVAPFRDSSLISHD